MSEPSLPVCPRDGFLMLRIHGRLECVVEYLDRCLGGQRFVEIVEQGRQLSCVFENGHTLPLICPCCGESLTMQAKTRQDMLGRRLEAMAWEMDNTKDGRAYPILYLEFARKGFFSRKRGVAVAPSVAARLHHPGDCPPRPRAGSGESRQKPHPKRR